MDKLISAEKLIQNIRKRSYIDKALAEIFETIIEEQPAAFDKEKVIEELDKCKQIMLSPASKDCFGEECRENDCMACVFNKAIEIVEKGGV